VKIILDRFSKLPISRQRRYQLRHQAKGLCEKCTAKRVTGTHCLKHAVESRDAAARRKGCVKKYRSITRIMERIKKQK